MDSDKEQFTGNKRTCYIDSLAPEQNSQNMNPFRGILAMLSADRFFRVLWLLERAIKPVTIMKIVIYASHLAAVITIEIQNLFASETILFRIRFLQTAGTIDLPVFALS